jgi:hypothetical protein
VLIAILDFSTTASDRRDALTQLGRSSELRRALQLTEERLGGQIRFEDLADEVGLGNGPRPLTTASLERTPGQSSGNSIVSALRS